MPVKFGCKYVYIISADVLSKYNSCVTILVLLHDSQII